jgi:DNA-binding HxlR family transcriptional regulator
MKTQETLVDRSCVGSSANDIAMKIVGDFWTLRIVDVLQGNELRFCEMERAIPDISPATLTVRLKKLEEAEVVERYVETKDKQSVSYGLTEKGIALQPVLTAIKDFTKQYGV